MKLIPTVSVFGAITLFLINSERIFKMMTSNVVTLVRAELIPATDASVSTLRSPMTHSILCCLLTLRCSASTAPQKHDKELRRAGAAKARELSGH